MTEEIKYYKEKEYPLKWIPAEEMEETPQQTIARLEQENKELKKQIESQKGLITVSGKQQYEMTMAYDKCKTALEEIREMCNKHLDAKEICYATQVIDKIDEVLK